MKIWFFEPSSIDRECIEQSADIDADPVWFAGGNGVTRNWINRTWWHLNQAGLNAILTGNITQMVDGIVICWAPHAEYLALKFSTLGSKPLLVAVRADSRPCYRADIEIVQNAASADGKRRHFIPHWPQPGLIPRRLIRKMPRTIAFKGSPFNLHGSFHDQNWLSWLETHGWSFDIDNDQGGEMGGVRWHDYSNVDIVLAVRRNLSNSYHNKPASKLVNAWAAGVPAILGPEVAYQEIRRSPLDYIEVRSIDDACRALSMLREDETLYTSMIENGLRRSSQFSSNVVTQTWIKTLAEITDRIPQYSSGGLGFFRPAMRAMLERDHGGFGWRDFLRWGKTGWLGTNRGIEF